jgi:ubiquinone/menaquinone biosynthesis C-methylase UbiE
MTTASAEYFQKIAEQWDAIRSGYFSDAVRETAIHKAYLRPEMEVADVGAGTGYLAAGLAPLVKQVYVLDGSAEMLYQARQNLGEFNNLIFQIAEGDSLPLPDSSLDAVFANMYLHHIPDPLQAIREMTRLLKPGGRLVITDMDAHPYTWLKEEMADVWQGFERSQMRAWFEAAGLVNTILDSTGEVCSSKSQTASISDPDGRRAEIGVFVAVGAQRVHGARESVEAQYGSAAINNSGCCSPDNASDSNACCGGNSSDFISLSSLEVAINPNYSILEAQSVPSEAATLALGCGNPTAMARIQTGETVLDIGSGAGMDAFLAARQVGPTGKVIGVDMTPAMLERARRAAAQAGLGQVEFRQGQAEALPVDDNTVDIIISNCVINLTEDKGLVFREAYRVLKPGGRLEVSDVVTDQSFPASLRANPEQWSGCVFGALPEQEYLDLVAQAGFREVSTQRSQHYGEEQGVKVYSLAISALK